MSRNQFGVRALLVLQATVAGFFCVALELSYVDATVILLALIALLRAARRPRRVHLATTIILTLVVGTLLWANLRPSGWQELWDMTTPSHLDPFTEKLFWRGWPLCPFMLCRMHHMALDPTGRFVQGALVLDSVVFVALIFVTKGLSEFCVQRFLRRKENAQENTPHNDL